MSRKATTEVDERDGLEELIDAPDRADGADEHGFWDGPSLDEHEPLVADDGDDEHETRVYMGDVVHTTADRDDVEALAGWAASKACDDCRAAIEADHDPDALDHDECRHALRVCRLLRRYP